MALQDLKTHCEKDEPRMNGAHARIDKLAEESKGTPGEGKRLSTKVVVITVVAILVVAIYMVLNRIDMSNDVVKRYPPLIDSYSFVNGANGMRISINVSDKDDNISSVTVFILAKAPNNSSYAWPPVLEKIYQVNQSSAKIADVMILTNLPAGDYRIQAQAADEFGMTSGTVFRDFSLP